MREEQHHHDETTTRRAAGAGRRHAASVFGAAAAPDLVAVFRHEPDLLTGLDRATADHLRQRVAAPKLWLERGPWQAPAETDRHECWLGLLVLEGAVVRSVTCAGRTYPELIGAGDIVRPWDPACEPMSVTSESTWTVLDHTVMAILDGRFAAAVGRYPSIIAQLLARMTARSRALAFTLTIAQVRHADTRLLALLWHLADRWGKVTPQGVVVCLPLTHETLAHLTCMRRPTASSALQRLRRAGHLDRDADGHWLLRGEAPSFEGGSSLLAAG